MSSKKNFDVIKFSQPFVLKKINFHYLNQHLLSTLPPSANYGAEPDSSGSVTFGSSCFLLPGVKK
jgi:hypothetical protein